MSYYVASRIMGGDWKNYSNEDGPVCYPLLESALCQAAMLQSRIREAMVFESTYLALTIAEGEDIHGVVYEQIAHYPLL